MKGVIYTAGVRGSFITDTPLTNNWLREESKRVFLEKAELALNTGITKEELIEMINNITWGKD